MPAPVARQLAGRIDGTAAVKVRKLRGRDFAVVPVVALIGNEVIHASNAPGPEFVPLAVLAASHGQWAGRPVVSNHPTENGGSANSPEQFAADHFGTVFHPRVTRGRLVLEAWLDLVRAQELGGDPLKVVQRALLGETVEVSVGCWVSTVPRKGQVGGRSYVAEWQAITSDHLAMLPEGVAGACSLEMGCGAPRAAATTRPTVSTPAAGTLTTAACGHDSSQCSCGSNNDHEEQEMSTKTTPEQRAAAAAQRVIDHYDPETWDGSMAPFSAEHDTPAVRAELRRQLAQAAAREAAALNQQRQERAEQRAAAAGVDDLELYRPKGSYDIAKLQAARQAADLAARFGHGRR
ncbi:MAG TPA: hypothetical protein VHQ65_07755 [Thermoanaerobaculia bacterium]|nr:hypothetical protein [Thermoanaerobaculia bacterium]